MLIRRRIRNAYFKTVRQRLVRSTRSVSHSCRDPNPAPIACVRDLIFPIIKIDLHIRSGRRPQDTCARVLTRPRTLSARPVRVFPTTPRPSSLRRTRENTPVTEDHRLRFRKRSHAPTPSSLSLSGRFAGRTEPEDVYHRVRSENRF